MPALGGSGGQVGPDLSSIGATAQIDYLIDSILEPNKAVKENYHARLITTKQGRQFTGIRIGQNEDGPPVAQLRGQGDRDPLERH